MGVCRNGAQLQLQLCLAHVGMNISRTSARTRAVRAGAFAVQVLGENPIEASGIVVQEGCEPNALVDFVAHPGIAARNLRDLIV
ncbi:hypothetical protein CQ12_37145 [Bradyrhizobium jicamae]|uniref:Uncharacterized protein n=1 Tax=Bradyrhizobium jicamae TaxID=280332 RepID=A0A0R3L4A9_9BRAD|nr:hypothetical protein CQ12_37145 [Bradyrhizobium jicamae]